MSHYVRRTILIIIIMRTKKMYTMCGSDYTKKKKRLRCVSVHGIGKTVWFRWWYLSDVIATASVPCQVIDRRTGCRCDVTCRGLVADERDKETVGNGRFGNGCHTGPRQMTSSNLKNLEPENNI
jgi:hypothetical protein